jgi:hypothetical protein
MSRNEELYKKLKETEGELQKVRERRRAVIGDKEIQSIVLHALTAEHLLNTNDPHLKSLWDRVDEKKATLESRELELKGKIKNLSKELIGLTKPAIERGIDQLENELRSARFESHVVERITGKVVLETNEDAVVRVHRIVKDAIEVLRGMELKPISEIEVFVNARLKEIIMVDLEPRQKIKSEVDHNRQEFITHWRP